MQSTASIPYSLMRYENGVLFVVLVKSDKTALLVSLTKLLLPKKRV